MPFIAFCAIAAIQGAPDLGKPVAEYTYYLQIEKSLPNGTPDLKVDGNHWKQATDEYYLVADTRSMDRNSDGKIHLPQVDLEFKTGGDPYTQKGRAPAGLTSDFHYVIATTGPGLTKFTYPAYDVNPGNQTVEYLVKTTILESEIRKVNRHRVTRTQTTICYGAQTVGLGPNEGYDPVKQTRFKI